MIHRGLHKWTDLLAGLKVDVPPPQDIPNPADLIGRTRLLFDLAHLALRTDSTRLITIMLAGSTAAPPIGGVSPGHHDLWHHGKDTGKLAQLKIVEIEAMKTVRDLLTKLRRSKEDDSNLPVAPPFSPTCPRRLLQRLVRRGTCVTA
jgi:hypothetical protein